MNTKQIDYETLSGMAKRDFEKNNVVISFVIGRLIKNRGSALNRAVSPPKCIDTARIVRIRRNRPSSIYPDGTMTVFMRENDDADIVSTTICPSNLLDWTWNGGLKPVVKVTITT